MELVELAKKIKDKELRKKTIDLIQNLELSNKNFKKYPHEKIEKTATMFVVPSAGMGPVERNVLIHTVTLVDLCDKLCDSFKKNYKLKLNRDYLITAALLHDIMKSFEFIRGPGNELQPTGILLDHTMLATAELYSRNFPEEVIHIVASHFGEGGPTPPRSFEALVFHYLDSMVSLVEYYNEAQQNMQKQIKDQVLMLTEKELEKLSEKNKKSKKSK